MKQKFNPEIWLVSRKKFKPEQWLERPANKNKPVAERSIQKNIHHDVEVVVQRIEYNRSDITTINHPYEDWVKLAFAFTDEFGEAGRRYFHRISRFYIGNNGQYDFAETDQLYSHCLERNKSGVTIKTFFQLAKDAGINIRV